MTNPHAMLPLVFKSHIGKDIAKIHGGTIKHITWMGVIIRTDDYGCTVEVYATPN